MAALSTSDTRGIAFTPMLEGQAFRMEYRAIDQAHTTALVVAKLVAVLREEYGPMRIMTGILWQFPYYSDPDIRITQQVIQDVVLGWFARDE